jgi:hypothetical protein
MKSLLVIALSIAAVVAADQKPKMTPAEHKTEAARHATRADEFAAKAKKHEANVERLSKEQGYNAMRYKWPALAKGPENLERDRAMQARRAEAESREKYAFHLEMANKEVEAEP